MWIWTTVSSDTHLKLQVSAGYKIVFTNWNFYSISVKVLILTNFLILLKPYDFAVSYEPNIVPIAYFLCAPFLLALRFAISQASIVARNVTLIQGSKEPNANRTQARDLSDKRLIQRFSNHGSRPKWGSPRLYEWVADKSRALSTLVIFNS